MKYLITGGAGFIGSYLVESLVARGDQVVVVDNLSTGDLQNLSKIKHVIKFKNFDILDRRKINRLVSKSDYIIHLAASLGVLKIVNEPLKSLRINLEGTQIILDAALRYNKPILLASTSEVYGKNEKVPLSEEDDRLLGHSFLSRWSYSEAKAIDESLAYFNYIENNLEVRIIRLFNTVGPRQIGNYGMVLPRFVDAAKRNVNLFVYGSGEQIRCFCHVKDAVKAILLVMDSEKAIGQVFNVGNNSQISIMELAKKVVEITGSKSNIEKIAYEKFYPEGFEDMKRRVPDISKIKQVLGWEPEIDLDEIIRDIAAFNSN